MQLDPISTRIHTPKMGKAQQKREPAATGPQDTLSSSPVQSKDTQPLQEFKNQSRQARRESQMRYQDDKAQAHVAGSTSFMGTIGTMSLKYPDGRWDLKALAAKAMESYDLATDYPADVKEQVADIVARTRPEPGVYVMPEDAKKPWVKDYRDKPLISIDNGTLWTEMDPEKLAKDPEANVSSRDIDQLQTAKQLDNGDIRITVAVSDVDAFVKKDSPLDKFMDVNTSSVYTPDKVFNLIPPELAEDIVSLNPREERLATVIEYTVTPDGKVKDEDVSQAIVKSRTKLDYDSVSAWMEGKADASPAMKAQGDAMLEDLRLQKLASDWIDKGKTNDLEVDRSESRIVTEDGNAVGVEFSKKGPANGIVENFMVTSNSVVSKFLRSKGYPTLERTLKEPEKWDRLEKLAKDNGFTLPHKPDAGALSEYLAYYKTKDPEGYDEMAVSIFKLSGRGMYEGIGPNEELPGQFFLGVKNYMQSTASIRRGGDRITPRMLKAALSGESSPYSARELTSFADNLNDKAQMLSKAERMATKMAVASMLEDRVGEQFDAVVTGLKGKQKWCRIGNPPVEGSLFTGDNVEVGDKLRVKLSKVNVEKGHIDFQKSGGR
ncbi:MAG: RNB domain-containing ribonuclease [Candidatus Eremiobacteraeota bacterium]|nr:RNB domain-containing ribonuclease [Candidatus Eremiobacteraeota bacterium]